MRCLGKKRRGPLLGSEEIRPIILGQSRAPKTLPGKSGLYCLLPSLVTATFRSVTRRITRWRTAQKTFYKRMDWSRRWSIWTWIIRQFKGRIWSIRSCKTASMLVAPNRPSSSLPARRRQPCLSWRLHHRSEACRISISRNHSSVHRCPWVPWGWKLHNNRNRKPRKACKTCSLRTYMRFMMCTCMTFPTLPTLEERMRLTWREVVKLRLVAGRL